MTKLAQICFALLWLCWATPTYESLDNHWYGVIAIQLAAIAFGLVLLIGGLIGLARKLTQ